MTNFVRNVQLTRKKRTGCHGLQGRNETVKRPFSDIYRTNRLPKERKISLNKERTFWGNMSKIGYIRVSTEHQETARQQEIMNSYQVDRIFSEKLSGANADRPQLKAMLDYVREGDTLYVESISRLGRSTRDLLNIIDTLTDKGVTLVSHKENIDTDTPAGKFMLTVFAALSQLEREQLKQRQREGIEIAKAQGKYTGRKPIEIDWTRFGQPYGEWKSKSITGRDFMRRMGLSANTFYRRVREYESPRHHRADLCMMIPVRRTEKPLRAVSSLYRVNHRL